MKSRPLHKRLALHPVSVLLLLCVGVLLAGVTFHGNADSYTVTAEVPAPPPSGPATITSPADQTHFTTTPITVSGTCPENTYVDLLRNNVFSGSAICGAGQTSYQLSAELSLGSNVLVAQVYNVTNQPGPASSPVTVFYDNPIQPPVPTPSAPPTGLNVTTQDNVPFQSGTVASVSPYVTERGTAPPNSRVVITFHSAPLSCQTYADNDGNWSCTLDQALPDGMHTVAVVATTPGGQVLTFPIFHIRVSTAVASLQRINTSPPFFITSTYLYTPLASGQSFSLDLDLNGGVAPYGMTILWGDGSHSTLVRGSDSSFSVKHIYNLSGARQQTYLVEIEAVDTRGSTAFLEVAELVHGSGWYPGAPLIIGENGPSSPMSGFRQWLWLIWPAYGVVALMVLSFWLGERQEYYNLFSRRHAHRRA